MKARFAGSSPAYLDSTTRSEDRARTHRTRSSSNLKRFARATSSSERCSGDGVASEIVQRSTWALFTRLGPTRNGTVEDSMRACITLAFCVGLLCAHHKEIIVVTGRAEPLPLAEADRDVSVVRLPEKQRELFNSWFD